MIKKIYEVTFFGFISTFVFLSLYFNLTEDYKTTATLLKVLEKESNNNSYQIHVTTPYVENPFTLQIDDENMWNSIKENEVYNITYKFRKKLKDAVLLHFEFPSGSDLLNVWWVEK
ncbi:hypothetical protein [Chengkuizengella axinellae]|uniref:DUF3139 domain-containing protein n=1 Tax=Chengkuizengella axinellae TaxID=3064388 RepID=A0ABT9J415_9BACL|nr:hypothetical protein [Chengkuizengella sp. 2205SS18-9]MDP5276182.1 hypothetical protein [Chengkuizengella sp. 2205SS18-9]